MPAKLPAETVERIIVLHRKCLSHERIAREVGVNRQTVEKYLSRHNANISKRFTKRAAAEKGMQIARLHWIAEQAIRGWERSQRDAETVKTVSGDGDGGDRIETIRKGQAGDPAFLAEARAAYADIRKILGLDAPTRVEATATHELRRIEIPDVDPRHELEPEESAR